GDPERLQQVIWNLLSNAIKFTPEGGRVEVRSVWLESNVEIVISDNGQGIDPEFLPYVFERFRQADVSTTRAHGGLGLGLAIVRHLVEIHGESIQAKSGGKGKGSIFTVRLPRVPYPNGTALNDDLELHKESSRRPNEILSRLRILVIND